MIHLSDTHINSHGHDLGANFNLQLLDNFLRAGALIVVASICLKQSVNRQSIIIKIMHYSSSQDMC